VLARVVGERDARLALDSLELLGEAERCREPDRAALAVAQTDRGDRKDDCAPGRGHVSERRRQIRVEDLVDVVGPADGHAATLSDPKPVQSPVDGARVVPAGKTFHIQRGV